MAADRGGRRSFNSTQLFLCFALLLFASVWVCSYWFLGASSCDEERERAEKAEAALFRFRTEQQSGPNGPEVDTSAILAEVKALRQQAADLERERNAMREKLTTGSGEASNFQAALVKSLQDELHSLKAQNAELQGGKPPAEKQQAPPPALRGGDPPAAPPRSDAIAVEDLKRWAAEDAVGVVIIVCKRPRYLERTMQSLFSAARDPTKFPFVISQDGHDSEMEKMIASNYVSKGLAYHMHHEHESSAQKIARQFGGHSAQGYVYIAQHFGFAMRQMFDEFGFEQVIFLEEDLEIAPDFFSYFGSMLTVLRDDPQLYCVSAWNDNGYADLVQDERAAYRTDFFPGLGWMMRKPMWAEVRDRWAQAYWDEFMRRPDVRHGRQCLRPEVSRSYTFGEEGTSSGQFFSQHLSRIKLNDVKVDWSQVDLSHLKTTEAFDAYLREQIQAARSVQLREVDSQSGLPSLRIEYDDARNYKDVAKKFGLMTDEKEGIRRMSYKGVIPFAWRGTRVYIHTSHFP